MDEWLETISDGKLAARVKDSLLISGGSITSLLLDQEVNDYDIYIKDVDTLKDLVKYYTAPYTNITVLDGRTDIKLDWLNNSEWIAKRTLKQDQIKLYFDESAGMRVNEWEENLNYQPVFFSPNAISLSNDIQIVCRFHWDNVAIHKTFDFIHATNYYTTNDGLVTNKEALESILTKQLKYQGSLYPLTTIIRIKKFLKRGWNISAGEMLKVMFQISELDLKNPDVLEEQLIGVDVAYFSALINILRNVEWDENKMISQYLNACIDKVFNEAE